MTKKFHIENIFLIIGLIFGIIILLIQPIFTVPDEFLHFMKAYFIFNGGTGWNEVSRIGVNLGAPLSHAPDSNYLKLYTNGQFIQEVFLNKVSFMKNAHFTLDFSFASIKWLPQAIGVLIGRLIYPSFGIAFMVGRIFNLTLYLGATFYAIKKAKFGKWVIAMIALLPISIQQAASLSYDVATFVTIFLTFSFLTNLWTRKEKLDKKWYIYSCLVLLLLFIPKLNMLALGIYFIALPTCLFGKNRFTKFLDVIWQFCSRFKWLIAVLIVGIFLIYFEYSLGEQGGISKGFSLLINTYFRLDYNTGLDSEIITGMIGNFGYMAYRLPEWLVVINFIYLFVLVMYEKKQDLEDRVIASSLIAFVTNIVVMTITAYLTFTLPYFKLDTSPYVAGVQGRYFTPFLILLVPIGVYFKKSVYQTSEKTIQRSFIALMSFNLLCFVGLTLLYYYGLDGLKCLEIKL